LVGTMSAETAPRADPSADPAVRPAPGLHLADRSAAPWALPPPCVDAIERPRLLRRLLDERPRLAVLAAPAGYGKTQLVADWQARDPRPFAWLRLTSDDDDPDHLLVSVCAALMLRPAALRSAVPGNSGDEVDTILRDWGPRVLVLDDLHVLRSAAARAIVAALADRIPAGGALVLVSRHEPAVSLGRLRARETVIELGVDRLAMTRREVAAALDAAGLCPTAQQLDRVLELSEGWPAAVRLIGRAVRDEGDTVGTLEAVGGDDSVIADYVREEVLAPLEPGQRSFLRRVAVLDVLSGPLCDAVLRRRGSGATLRALAAANVLVLPLDRAHLTFRLHPLCAQALRAELRCIEPETEPELHRRASDWYAGCQEGEHAIEHAVAAGDVDRVDALLSRRAARLLAAGRAPLVDRWLGLLPAEAVAARPGLALAAAAGRAVAGDRDAAERWTNAALARLDASGEPETCSSAGVAAVRAAVARDGIEQMVRDARAAYTAMPGHGMRRAWACLLLGAGQCLGDDPQAGAGHLDEGARAAGPQGPVVRELCLALRVLVDLHGDELEDAAAGAARARKALAFREPCEDPAAALTYAVSAATLAHAGAIADARQDVERAVRAMGLAGDSIPWYAACVELALARAELRLSDGRAARELLARAARRLRDVPGATTLQAWVDDAWARADDYAVGAEPSALTLAELRVLRLLPTHLVFREIAARLHVSANTVKTQAHAVYRKLDVSSRAAAVERAQRIGLIDP
jgi:LuxR family maltose regulon positive regulatory protein